MKLDPWQRYTPSPHTKNVKNIWGGYNAAMGLISRDNAVFHIYKKKKKVFWKVKFSSKDDNLEIKFKDRNQVEDKIVKDLG